MKRAVVTGGAGFIGSNLVDGLVQQGVSVLVVDDFSTGDLKNLELAKKQGGASLRILELDICDPATVSAIEEFKPHLIFHQAAQANVRHSVEDPVFDARKNVLGTINILEGARRAKTERLLFASTGGAIYGEQVSFPATEDHPVHPECPYGVSKRAAELYLEYYSRTQGLAAVALRYSNVYGPRQNPKGEAGVVAIFIERLLSGKVLKVNGDGKQTRDFVFVGDVVQANLLASGVIGKNQLKGPGTLTTYNVGRGTEDSVLDIINVLRDLRGNYRYSVQVEHGPALPGEQRRSVIDAEKINRELGWIPEVDLKGGLQKTLESFRIARE